MATPAPDHPFVSSLSCLSRAEEHISELKQRWEEWFKSNPYTALIEIDPATGEKIHKVKFTRPVPASLTTIAADAANNMRYALDHAGFAVAVAAGNPDPKKAYFPFSSSVTELENVIRGNCKDIPDEIVTLFRTFKPYKGGNNLLWAINAVCNANKHRVLSAIGVTTGGGIRGPINFSGPTRVYLPRFDSRKQEIILVRSRTDNLNYKLEFTLTIAFDKVEIVRGKHAIPILDQMSGMVKSILLATEAEARRVGLFS